MNSNNNNFRSVNSNNFMSVNNNNNNKTKTLRSVIKKSMQFVFRRSNTVNNRLAFARKMHTYFKKAGARSCLGVYHNKLAMIDRDGDPIIAFDTINRIGSKSAYGLAHLHRGRGPYVPFKFASKITAFDESCEIEILLLDAMTSAVMRHFSPNFPVTYTRMVCRATCTFPHCPRVIRNKPYAVIVSELADADLQNWLVEKRTVEQYQSVLVQLVLSIYAFQQLGVVHRDTHLGNFLVHRVTPGGYWRYVMRNPMNEKEPFHFYMKNCGWLLVIWDPGMAEEWRHPRWVSDYSRPLRLLNSVATDPSYVARGMKPLPRSVSDHVTSVVDLLQGTFLKYNAPRDDVHPMDVFAHQFATLCSVWFPKVVTRGVENVSKKKGRVRYTAPGILLNVRPYLNLDDLPNTFG